jgi:hypothetical protein
MIDVEELEDENESRKTYSYTNGAPLVSDPENPDKMLRYSRPSGYGKVLDDEMALTEWRIWKAMNGVATSPALAAEVVATKDEDRLGKKALREKALDKGTANEAADMGTALHAMTHRTEDDTDVDFAPAEQYVPDLDAYMNCLRQYGLVSEMIEVPLVNDEFRAAGTADRIFRLTKALTAPDGSIIDAGTLVLGDIKTGKKLDFSLPGYAIQMALYAQGTLYDVVTNRRLPTPKINNEWTILIHLPVGQAKCELLWLSIEIGNYGAWLAHEIKEWRKKWKNGTYDGVPIPVPLYTEAAIAEAFDAVPEIPEEIVPQMVAYCQARISQAGAHEAARKWLTLKWPAGVPTPKQGLAIPSDIVKVLDLLDKIEAEFSLPFMPDPRGSEGHRGKIDRSNERQLLDTQGT